MSKKNIFKSLRSIKLVVKRLVGVFTAGSFSLTTLPLYAAEAIPSPAFDGRAGVDTILQVLFALLCVILLMVFLSVLIKKYNILPNSSSNQIKVISGLALNNKDKLLLVKVGTEHLLIGTSPGNINKLHTLKNYSELEDEPETGISAKGSFQSLFRSMGEGSRQ